VNKMERVWNLLEEVRPKIDRFIKDHFSDYVFSEEALYHLNAGGKRWRPALMMVFGRICDVNDMDLIPLASVCELLHNLTLIHDDVMDRDEYRRNQLTVWKKFGAEKAITVGDGMFGSCISYLSEYPPEIIKLYGEALAEVAEGQYMDLDMLGRYPSEHEYMEMVEKKTGALIDLSIEVPQVLSEKNFQIENFHLIGSAFQIQDDILDFEEGKGRKKVGNDVRAGKRTIMAIHANSDEVYSVLDKPFDQTTETDVEIVKRIFEEKGSFDHANNVKKQMARKAKESLEALPESEERDLLEAGCKFTIERGT